MPYSTINKGGYTYYINETSKGEQIIGCHDVPVIEQDGLIFKDLARTGELLPYEDWRLEAVARAEDLTGRLSVSEMIGLMLHSSQQPVPVLPHTTIYIASYSGKPFLESGAEPWELNDQQKIMLEAEHIRHVLASRFQDVKTGMLWCNNLQKLAEGLPHGIPVGISTDPRHGAANSEQEFRTAASGVSIWPEGIGISATFSQQTCKDYAETVSKEYRALGITTALGPQIDLTTEPRWFRIPDTFGSHTEHATKLASICCNGMQSTDGSEDGWGNDSVIAMAKHWPGGGTGEGGRDAHYPFGKYAVYPGDNFDDHLKPFTEGAMKLDGKTSTCAAIMPYYNIPWQQDTRYGENVGNAYSKYIIADLLREEYAFEGVVCTDWNIVQDMTPAVGMYVMGGKCHGVEHLTIQERFLTLIMNGVNQFGGVDSGKDVLEAYELGCDKHGQEVMDRKMKASAVRILTNMFRVGIFENPYVDIEESLEVIGCEAHMKAGYEAQVQSVVMLKNKSNVLPLKGKMKVYVPDRTIEEVLNFVRFTDARKELHPIDDWLLSQYFVKVDKPEDADAAIVFIDSPIGNGGYSKDGYEPISLQYRPYSAVSARLESIAGGDPREETRSRGYRGKTAVTANESDLDNIIRTKSIMQEKPLVVCIRMKVPTVFSEFEPYADAILADFGVQKSVLLDIITGEYSTTGKLPFLLPKDMETVERHCEDMGFDMEAYIDSEGNEYQFGFGLDYDGKTKEK